MSVCPNGAGKTTLCLTLNGLIPHAVRGSLTGRVTVCGVDTATVPVHELAPTRGRRFAEPGSTVLRRVLVEEELAFGPENLCLPTEEIERRVVASLATVGVVALRDQISLYHLSGGQKQRVAIATALAMQPQVLVLDEPTSELDPQGKEEVLAAIGSLRRELGQTVMIVSHENLDELVHIVDRVVALSEDGRLVADGSPAEVLGGSLVSLLGLRQPQLFELWQDRPGPPPLTVEQAAAQLRGGLRVGAVPLRTMPVAAVDAPVVIECRDLRYAYANGVEALRGIDLRIRRGEFVALMGPNGSGKTTLSKHLNGLLRPRSGKVTVAGLDAAKTGTAEMARRVGYAFQNPDHQLFAGSVAEEFAFGLRNIGVPDSEIRERTDTALAQAGLHLAPDAYPHFLGKGQRQRLALASILAMRPEILVIDEPTTGQDWRNAKATMRTLEALNRDGLTIVFVTHDARLVAEHAQRVVVMAEGSIIADGDPSDVFHDRAVMQRASIRPPPIMQLAAALHPDPARLGVRTVADFRAAWAAE